MTWCFFLISFNSLNFGIFGLATIFDADEQKRRANGASRYLYLALHASHDSLRLTSIFRTSKFHASISMSSLQEYPRSVRMVAVACSVATRCVAVFSTPVSQSSVAVLPCVMHCQQGLSFTTK